MNYQIEDKPAFTIAAKGIRVGTADGEHSKAIPAFWKSVPHTERLYSLQRPDGVIGKAVLGVCSDAEADMSAFTYSIAVEAADDADFGEYTRIDAPAATWAVFESLGKLPETIQALWGQIMTEFFPSSGYQHAPGLPEIEMYPPGNVSSDDYRCEVWIPIVKS
jgi:AraC family transcriptional regulator